MPILIIWGEMLGRTSSGHWRLERLTTSTDPDTACNQNSGFKKSKILENNKNRLY
jgi:hypothetical protein